MTKVLERQLKTEYDQIRAVLALISDEAMEDEKKKPPVTRC